MSLARKVAGATVNVAALGALSCLLVAPRRSADVDRRWKQFRAHRYAHRGLHDAAAGVPENSLLAFRRAREAGYGAELDVHLTADGKLVVIHDADLARVTGREGVVEDLTLEELGTYRLQGTDERIPTLGEVLRLWETAGDGLPAPLIVELKVERRNWAELCERTLDELDRHPGLRYVIESFDPRALMWLRRHRPEVIRGQLAEDFMSHDDATYLSTPVRLALSGLLDNVATRPDFVAYRFEDRRRPGVALCRALGGRPVYWTISSADEMLDSEMEGAPIIFEGFRPRPSSTIA